MKQDTSTILLKVLKVKLKNRCMHDEYINKYKLKLTSSDENECDEVLKSNLTCPDESCVSKKAIRKVLR